MCADWLQYGADLSGERLEVLRLSATKHGPLAEIVDRCISQIREMPLVELDPVNAVVGEPEEEEGEDKGKGAASGKGKAAAEETVLSRIVGRLKDILVAGIGLPARGATAKLIVTLVTIRGDMLKPYAMILMRALQVRARARLCLVFLALLFSWVPLCIFVSIVVCHSAKAF